MTQLWVEASPEEWAVLRLDESSNAFYSLNVNPPRVGGRGKEAACARSGVLLLPGGRTADGNNGEGSWLVLSAAGRSVYINGLPLTTGICQLSDRDEVRVEGSGTFYFSTERLAHPEKFVKGGGGEPTICPRCRQPIVQEQTVVRCPNCRIFYHHLLHEELPCWTYDAKCLVCGISTDLEAGFRWSPDEL